MKKTAIVMIAVLVSAYVATGFSLPVCAMDLNAITAKPTADNPQFENKEAWPMLVGDEYFAKQKWDEGRTLILNTELLLQDVQRERVLKLDCSVPSSWINAATGKPAVSMPDMNTSIILPDSEIPYFAMVKSERRLECRHVTVGRNATLSPKFCRGGGGFKLTGSLWIRPTGSIQSGMYTIGFIGDKHTFIRYDWPEDGVLKKLHDQRAISPYKVNGEIIKTPWLTNRISTYMRHDKQAGVTTEVLGLVRLADEIQVQAGTIIVGRDSRFVSTGPSCVSIANGAKVVLMDGAQCSHGRNQFANRDWGIKAGGAVTGGTPDRPLRRDAYMGMGYRNWQNLPVPPSEGSNKPIRTTEDGTKLYYAYGKYSTLVSGDLIGYPAPGSNARLVVCWQRIASGGAGNWGRTDEAFQKVFPKFLPKIKLWISDTSKVENVRFDDLQPGGIVTKSLETFESWKNVSFGDGCLRPEAKDLVRSYEAELAEMGGGHPASMLPPKKQYTTP